ncbi:PREDICTED: peptidyl-alpha-hydroxyglycine alpha-amidating lyase 2-like [Polistes dominula]|uniref:peptidylamidoglycolate lyase n=1 Tax=Polistes dominula TaxID=743375 RepID=A0ABM1I3I8_POLDO|nr:PREDICTED: peptidyl-alpha-hydroxyglycine alpha-amidating lyase 2-like [Polistes dominula]
MPRKVTGQILLVFLSLFLFNDVSSGSFDDGSDLLIKPVRLTEYWDEYASQRELTPIKNVFWQGPTHLGQISGVSVDPSGYPVIFHRADRIWEFSTFTKENVYTERDKGPITEDTVLTLDPGSGNILRGWGRNMFYLPHGIHVDNFGNVWLTDIALHQVFKFNSSGRLKLILGKRFKPGNDLNHFCQPTSVAVAPLNGNVFIADGYCNNRIVLYDSMGNSIRSIDEHPLVLNIPHSLTILSNGDLCVADRENGRVICTLGLAGLRTKYIGRKYSIPVRGRIFGVASYNNTIYAVGTVRCGGTCAMGYTIDTYFLVFNVWPTAFNFQNPHDIAIDQRSKSLYVSEIGPNRIEKFDLLP